MSDNTLARQAWERLLARPPEERKFKSTWAAYMLGKSWELEDLDKARTYYAKVRELASQPRLFSDSAGLSAASLGWEARLCLRQDEYERAILLYLDQLSTGDESAVASLRFAARRALQAPMAQLSALAKNAPVQKVLTAYLISQPLRWESSVTGGDGNDRNRLTLRWLLAAERSGVNAMACAEQFALAAYQANAPELVERWAKRSSAQPVSQLIQAKLCLRKGKVVAAAAILSRLTAAFPLVEAVQTNSPPNSLFDRLYYSEGEETPDGSARRRTRGELGVLQLARRDYVQALDALLRSGYESDAYYVAERVLTVDELKTYVDQHWPATPPPARQEGDTDKIDSPETASNPRQQIRHLLARRLTRSMRGDEAGGYYPPELHPSWQALVRSLRSGHDESLDTRTRAQALFEAAFIARTNGMELLGTALEPDWFINGGAFDMDSVLGERTAEKTQVAPPSENELQRAAQHVADPPQRFHYRYQAALLAWEAASLLPDNDDLTARILWQGGTWLKYRDPQTADLFYKALVRRNRRTQLGNEADRQRWFPVFDEAGNIIPRKSKSLQAEPMPGSESQMVPSPDLPDDEPASTGNDDQAPTMPPADEASQR